MFNEQDIIELLHSDIIEPLDQSPLKRKVTFTGSKGSPPKISCPTDEDDQFQDIEPLEETLDRNQDATWKTRNFAMKDSARE